jgi:hypothetical protein
VSREGAADEVVVGSGVVVGVGGNHTMVGVGVWVGGREVSVGSGGAGVEVSRQPGKPKITKSAARAVKKRTMLQVYYSFMNDTGR